MTLTVLIMAALFLAYANGANDNFKGVATLFGSRTSSYRVALFWAAIATFAGSLASALLAGRLLLAFRGKGLVADALVAAPEFGIAVGVGAAGTVILASRLGFPVSTTHALVGALLGAGLVAQRGAVRWAALGGSFVAPLLLTPLLAVGLTVVAYRPLRALRRRLGATPATCVCVEAQRPAPAVARGVRRSDAAAPVRLGIVVEHEARCGARPGRVLGFSAARLLAAAHYVSAGLVSFARGLNDTPKIAAFLLAGGFAPGPALWLVGAAMACGGLLSGRRVAMTMSRRVTALDHGQGFTANAVTGFLVIFASRWGLPASTTHVSCGTLFGIGWATGGGRPAVIRNILLAWITTLPVAALLGALAFALQPGS